MLGAHVALNPRTTATGEAARSLCFARRREIPLIADEYAKPEFGSGAVKVTPAHDLNDFEVGIRHNLPKVIVIDEHGKMSAEAGKRFAGLDRFEARERVLEDLQALGVVDRIEDYTVPTAMCARCHTIIEPLLSEQWFVRMKELAQPAIDVVRQGRVKFYPDRSSKHTSTGWRHPRGTISRQLWWGHRIPVWTSEAGEYIVARSPSGGAAKANGKKSLRMRTCSTPGSPRRSGARGALAGRNRLKTCALLSDLVLATARDIIYLWVCG